jgi:hypothetical protein
MIKESLFAAEEREAKLDKLGDVLQVLEKHVDFAALAKAIDQAAPRPSQEKGGRPPYPTEIMVRAVVLQQLYSLSDEQMEFQLLDRLSFQRFVGLRHSSQIPDRTTFWTFKERLISARHSAPHGRFLDSMSQKSIRRAANRSGPGRPASASTSHYALLLASLRLPQ